MKTKKRKQQPRRRKVERTRRSWLFWWAAAFAAGLFIYLAASADRFLQDDAYISFRYVQNYLAGEGLVFNAGERVEGYTNFLWVILLALITGFGGDLTGSARWLGIFSTAGAAVATIFLARRVLAEQSTLLSYTGSIAAGLWVAVNPALAYWAIAGLETGLFVLLVTWSVERFLAGSRLGWSLLTLATLTRPEGGLVFVLVYLWFLWHRRGEIKSIWWRPLLDYGLPLLPFALFKLFYYGSLFPNPFFAKTGFSPEYWQSGWDYLWLYLQHFGLWGVVPLLLVFGLLRSGRRSLAGLPAIIWLGYTVYIIAIGGDVLRAHRFFVPVWPLFAIAAIAGFIQLARLFGRSRVIVWVVGVLLLATAGYQWRYSNEYFAYSRMLEMSIVEKMRTVADLLSRTDPQPFSIAASTIGRLGYELPGHPVIDVLGLTDSTVARHPETIPGMQTTWKERHFNAGYVLGRDPDYILFSTGYKPSAPAERALVLHSKFRQNYYVSLYPAPHLNRNLAVYKRKGDFTKPDSVWPDLQLANDFNDGLNHLLSKKPQLCFETFSRMKHEGPGDYDIPDVFMAEALLQMSRLDEGLAHADSALAINPYAVPALMSKMDVYRVKGETEQAARIATEIQRICPWIAY